MSGPLRRRPVLSGAGPWGRNDPQLPVSSSVLPSLPPRFFFFVFFYSALHLLLSTAAASTMCVRRETKMGKVGAFVHFLLCSASVGAAAALTRGEFIVAASVPSFKVQFSSVIIAVHGCEMSDFCLQSTLLQCTNLWNLTRRRKNLRN